MPSTRFDIDGQSLLRAHFHQAFRKCGFLDATFEIGERVLALVFIRVTCRDASRRHPAEFIATSLLGEPIARELLSCFNMSMKNLAYKGDVQACVRFVRCVFTRDCVFTWQQDICQAQGIGSPSHRTCVPGTHARVFCGRKCEWHSPCL